MRSSRLLRPSGGGLAALLAGALAAATLTGGGPAAAATHTAIATPQKAAPSSAASSRGKAGLSARDASLQARQTGKSVVATQLTTGTSQTVANPNGTLTLTQTAAPTRAFQHGAWAALDGTLHTNSDGTLSPAATPNSVTLSGGGTGPLAQLYNNGQGFSLTLPVALPHPVVSGDSALYAGVIPGVDLTVTVGSDGTVSDVFTVKNAAAAKDPRLAGLLDAATTTTRGLTTATDARGDIGLLDAKGHPVFTATAPQAWDSQQTALPHAMVRAGSPVDAVSSTDGPGHGAHTAKLVASAAHGHLALAAPGLLTDSHTVFPVYLDPTYSPSYGTGTHGWTSVGSAVGDTNYWNGTVDYGTGDSDAEVGNSGSVQGEAMSLFNLPVPTSLKGAHIYWANFGITENASWACLTSGHDQYVNLYAPSSVLSSSNATWNSWVNNLGSQIGHESYAMGYSGCPGGGVPAYNVYSTLTSDINSGKSIQTLALRADDGSDNYAFKEFTPSSAQWTVNYDWTPNTPSGLYTSPVTHCSGTLGDTSVTLYAPVSTPANSSLTTTFHLYKGTTYSTSANLLTSANGVASDTYGGASGQVAVLALPESFFKTQSGGAATTYSWIAETSDGTLTSSWSSQCSFTWDPTKPGNPSVTPTQNPTSGSTCATVDDTNSADTVQQVGTSCSFTLAPPTTNGTATAVSGYVYQVNQAPPVTVTTTGSTAVTVPLSRLVNTLTVNALSAGGNLGAPTVVWFDGTKISPKANDGDLSLDGTPDLIVAGNAGSAFAPGLWLATGKSDGTVAANGVNIGVNGLGYNTSATPTDWNGAQAVSGDFCNYGAQDVFGYYPTGANAGGGAIVCNDGSGGALHLGSPTTIGNNQAPFVIPAQSFSDGTNNATQVVTAGSTSGKGAFPDLLATINNQLVLAYSQTANGYATYDGIGECDSGCILLSSNASPDGTGWNNWTLASTQLSSGTALYLWNSSTGELDLWTGLALDSTGKTLTYTANQIYAPGGFNKGATRILRAADITGAGIPDLWSTDPSTGTTTTYMPSAIAPNPTVTTTTATFSTAAHAWHFQDMGGVAAGTTVTSTADSIGSTGLAGTAGANWNTGGAFSPDVAINSPTAGTGSLASSASVVNTGSSFTVSAWVDPDTLGGTVLAQNGTTGDALRLYTDSATDTWRVDLTRSDSAAPVADTATAAAMHALTGQWSYLTVTYDSGTKHLALYVNGLKQGGATATSPWTPPATGTFTLGAYQSSGKLTGYFQGEIGEVQTWNAVLPATQIASLDHVTVPAAHPYHDFNGDGIDDAALWYDYGTGGSCNGSIHHTKIFTLSGDSSYNGNLNWPVDRSDDPCWGAGTRMIATGDFNGDGKTDIAVWYDYGSNGSTCTGVDHDSLFIWYADANGDGGLQPPVRVWDDTCWGHNTIAMAAGDFNGDGKADLALFYAYSTSHVTVFTMTAGANNTMGGPVDRWTTSSWNGQSDLMTVGDFNGDGKSDVAVWENQGGTHDTLYTLTAHANGDGGLNAPTTVWDNASWGAGTQELLAGDFNGDGKSDLAILYRHDSNHISVDTMTADTTGTGAFAIPVQRWDDTVWGSGATYMGVGDYNGSGKTSVSLFGDSGTSGSTCSGVDHVTVFTLPADTNGDGGFGSLYKNWDDTCWGGGTLFLN